MSYRKLVALRDLVISRVKILITTLVISRASHLDGDTDRLLRGKPKKLLYKF
jgi:hypothetical protein